MHAFHSFEHNRSTPFYESALCCSASTQEPEVEVRKVKMAVGRERKTGNVMISPQEH